MAKSRGQKTKGAGSPGKPRMTVARKIDATVRVIRGEPMELVARDLGVTAADVSRWHEALFEGAECALKEKKSDPKDKKIGRLQSLLGETTMDNELLREKIERLETGRPLVRRRSRR